MGGARVTLYQPQIERWEDFTTLQFRLAAVFVSPDHDHPLPASLRIEASTTTDVDARTVTAHDMKLLAFSVAGADDAMTRQLEAGLIAYMSGKTQTVSLDTMLAHFETADEQERPEFAAAPTGNLPQTSELAGQPPEIFISTTPSILVMFDGEPIFVEIEETELEFAVNTNWDVFRHSDTSTVYLRVEDAWLEATDATGPWAPAMALPDDFSSLPETASFEPVRTHVPGRTMSADTMPQVFVSTRPAELIVLDGQPIEEAIPETDLLWITNTDSDLFRSTQNNDYYFLVSGRWFRAPILAGPWSPASSDLPETFAAIPVDHPKASVRVSVPGTPEADEAVMLATIPQKAEIRRDEAAVEVRYDGDPDFQKVDGTTVYYAANTAFDVFRVGPSYYVCFNGVWFVSNAPEGPWEVTDFVPASIYNIPPSNPKHHVTYVRVYDSTPDVVVVGYTQGYTGVYVSNGAVVYGTGWYYPPYVYYPAYGYPVYRAYPYSYGVAAYYNPYTYSYARGASVYGPYGGAGWGSAYNPATGTYSRGVAAWGPYEAGYARQAYNPYTDTYGATYQRSNAYASWGESVISRGDEWVRTANYSDSRGSAAGIETSQGGQAGAVATDQGTAYAGKDADNNLYAGKDGNVYRRSDEGWSTYNDGDWQSVDQTAVSERAQSLQGSADRDWSALSGQTFDGLDRDLQARGSAVSRSLDRERWMNNRQSRSSTRGSRPRRR